MTFNLSYDAAATVFLLIICWQFFSQRQFPLLSNRVFAGLLILTVSNLALDILGTIVLNPIGRFPLWLCYAVNILYYMVELLLPSALTIYVLALADVTDKKIYLTVLIPSILCELLFLVGMPQGMVFSITLEEGYTYGAFSSITYVCMALNLVLSIGIIIRYRNILHKDEKQAITLLILLVVLTSIIQFYHPSLLLTGFAIASALTMMYFTIQNPERMLDATTMLFNSSALRLYLRALLVRHQRFHVAVLKVHGLHRLNTIHGIDETDRLLLQFGNFLSSHRRIWAFRLGNSRFAVISTHEESFKAFLYDTLNASGKAPLTFSLCHIQPVKGFEDPDEALAIMDSVLSSRQVTENHVPFWVVNASDIAAIRRENDIESALRDAIPQAEGFELFCQPIYRHDKGCFDSGELLLRFRAPELGPISPDEFISVAENNALATSLDRMVVSMAFDAISEGRFDGLGFHHIQLNLSAASIIDPETVSAIIDIAESRGIDPAFVVFEITETTTTFSEELAVESIHRLQEYGFRFALDDFGTGYATITRLVELPFCIVKLDRTLLSFSPDLFRRIIRLFEHMDVELEAEGVETDEQSDFVVSTGIRLIQGYRYSKPMPIGELKEFLRRDKKPVRLVI